MDKGRRNTKETEGKRDTREERVRVVIERAHGYERAMEASRLMEDKWYSDTEEAVTNRNEKLFRDTCEKAGVSPDLANHMWKIIDASWEKVYAKHNPGPLW